MRVNRDLLPDPRKAEPPQRPFAERIGIDREEIAKIARKHHEQALIRHDQTGMLLGMSDEELADIGVSRGDMEAYRAGRIKFLRRRFVENEAAA